MDVGSLNSSIGFIQQVHSNASQTAQSAVDHSGRAAESRKAVLESEMQTRSQKTDQLQRLEKAGDAVTQGAGRIDTWA